MLKHFIFFRIFATDMTALAIDIGNTLTKWGIFKDGEMLSLDSAICLEEQHIRKIKEQLNLDAYIVSSVAKTPDFIHRILDDVKHIVFDHHTPLPLINLYETPETLGLDRLAMAVAAVRLAPQTDALIISAGTCITADYVTAKGEYLGGTISPGLRMRAHAMHEFTERLPLVELPEEVEKIGKNSTSAIQSGIIGGAQDEISSKFLTFREKHPGGKIFLTGGDRNYFVNSTKSSIFVVCNLVLIGLHEILRHNI